MFILRLKLLFLFTILNFTNGSWAFEFSSSINPVGAGARATGIGGAFIAVADDATAASWNPAGLIQLREPEASLVYSSYRRDQNYTSGISTEHESDRNIEANNLNFVSISSPILNWNLSASLNYQRLYELGKETAYSVNRNIFDQSVEERIQFQQTGSLGALSMAFSYKPPYFPVALGLSLNEWSNNVSNGSWKSKYRSELTTVSETGQINSAYRESDDIDFSGQNYNIGALWTIYDFKETSVTVGVVYKSGFDAILEATTNSQETITNSQGVATNNLSATREFGLRMPPSQGIGIAYHQSDDLMFSFDVYRTNWSQYALTTPSGEVLNPISLIPISSRKLQNTSQVRVGLEYVLADYGRLIALRSGLFLDPQPQTDRVDKYKGFSFGVGYTAKTFSLDISYQYRYGNNVTSDIFLIDGSNMDVTQQNLLLSTILYF